MGHVALLALREDRLPLLEVPCLHRVEQLLQLVNAQRREELDLAYVGGVGDVGDLRYTYVTYVT